MKHTIKKYIIHSVGIVTLVIIVLLITKQNAHSFTSIVRSTEEIEWDLQQSGNTGTVPVVNQHITQEFEDHRSWLVGVLWEDNILPAMQLMSEQITAVAMQQTMIFGTFLDAKHQMETQRLFQKIQARAHKDYHPSVGMCEFGSGVKSLAASERQGEANTLAITSTLLDRHLGNESSSAAQGHAADLKARIAQYKTDFCNQADNNGNIELICDSGSPNKERMNNDINYAKILEGATESEIDFSDGINTDDEQDIIALANNLYGHEVFARPPAGLLKDSPYNAVTPMQEAYLDMRAIIAKRSVAENSFNAIMGMKSQGTSGSKSFLEALLKDLGIPDTDAKKILGSKPSYDTQMDILTKKIYQNPNFYTNLYDKPANVARKGVAMQGIGLMQKFDMFKSQLRSEASMSILLELAVAKQQREIENEINAASANMRDAK